MTDKTIKLEDVLDIVNFYLNDHLGDEKYTARKEALANAIMRLIYEKLRDV